MEVLGFSETPATIYDARQIWVETEAVSTQEQQKPDFFTSWLPSDFGTVLLGRRIRWGVVITTTLLVALVVATALWVYRRPTVEAARARDQVSESIATLAPELERLRTVNATLDAEEIDGGAATEVSLAVDAGVRRLFEAVGQLKEEDSDARTRLIAVTGQIAESARRFSDAVAVRSAVLPALVPPALPVGADVDLEEATATFAEWQARYESLREALPEATFREVSEAMAALSANLTGHQRLYLDSLADGDEATASGVVSRIASDLEEIRDLLVGSLTATKEQVETGVAEAEEALERALSLLG
jgi:hypothetical protein